MTTPFQLSGTRIRYSVPSGRAPLTSWYDTWACAEVGVTASIVTASRRTETIDNARFGGDMRTESGLPAIHPPSIAPTRRVIWCVPHRLLQCQDSLQHSLHVLFRVACRVKT